MEMNSLYQLCIFFTIGITIFSSCVTFVSGLGLFGPADVSYGENSSSMNASIHGYTKSSDHPVGLGMGDLFSIVITAGTAAALAGSLIISYITGSTTYVGIYLFSVYFWSTFTTAFGIFGILGLPLSLLGLFTVPIAFIFIGAVIGMLSGV